MKESLIEKCLENLGEIHLNNYYRNLSYFWTFTSGVNSINTYNGIQERNLKTILISGGCMILSSGLTYFCFKQSKFEDQN